MIFALGGIEAITRAHPEDKAPVDTIYRFEVDLHRAKLFDPESGRRLDAAFDSGRSAPESPSK